MKVAFVAQFLIDALGSPTLPTRILYHTGCDSGGGFEYRCTLTC